MAMNMQVSVENVSNIERRMTIVVSANYVEEAYNDQINDYAKKVELKGFRPGKAPVSQIKQQFGESARQKALNTVIQKALYDALVEKKLNPVSQPRVEPKLAGPDQPLEFVVSFEVLPEIGTINLKIDSLEKLAVEVTNEDVERVINQLKKQYAKWKVVERAAKEKDRVVIDYYAIFDGKSEEESKVENYPLELGSKSMLPGFEDGLIGAKAGDEKTLKLTFPEDFGVAERAGKPIDFVVTVKQVYEADIPVVNDDFVAKLGIKNGQIEELKQQIKQSLEQERDRLVKDKLKEQIFLKLIEQNPLEVPKALIHQEAANIHDEIYPQHQHHDHHQHSNEEMAAFNDIAKKRVTLGLLVAEYAKQANLKADETLVQQRIQEIAAAYENPQEVINWLSSGERRSGIEAQVMEDQVMNKLMEDIPSTVKKMSYAELKGIRI